MNEVDNQDKPLAMTYIVCGVVIEKDGKYLLIQEKQPKAYGKWNLPAGKVDAGESLEQAAVREAKEECGLDVELVDYLPVIHTESAWPVLHAYSAKIIGGEIHFPENEILDAKWFTYEEIKAMESELRTPVYVLSAIESLTRSV